jgi:hypothetical protein
MNGGIWPKRDLRIFGHKRNVGYIWSIRQIRKQVLKLNIEQYTTVHVKWTFAQQKGIFISNHVHPSLVLLLPSVR